MLRATHALNSEVERVGVELGVPVVDLVEAIGRASRNGVPGDDLFLDNCHPTRRGASVIALETARAMLDDSLLRVPPLWEEEFLAATAAYLDTLEIPDAAQAEALKFLLYYSLDVNPDDSRAALLERELERLDPHGRYAGRPFREYFFRTRLEPEPSRNRQARLR